MKKRIHLSVAIAGMLALLVGCTGSRAYRDAREEEALQHWDLAVLKYSRAVQLDPVRSRLVATTGLHRD